MGIVVDLIIVFALAGSIITSYKKGLTGSLIKLASFAVAVILAFALYKPLATYIKENTQIDQTIQTTIKETFGKEQQEQTTQTQSDNIPAQFVENIGQEINTATTEARNQIVEETARNTSTTIINVGSGIIIFIVARLILLVISLFAKAITSLPIISQIDKIGGIAYGLVEGMLIIYVVLGLISLTSLVWPGNTVVTAIGKSALGEMLYNNNIILKIFFK